MKQAKTERLFLILSLLTLIIGATIYVAFAHNYGSKPLNSSKQNTGKVVKKANYLSKAIEAVNLAESSPSMANIETAQKLVNKLKKSETKSGLQEKLDRLKKIVSSEEKATKAVEEAEKNPTLETVETAQTAINQVSNKSKKAELQNRLDTITTTNQIGSGSESTMTPGVSPSNQEANSAYLGQNPAESYVPQAPLNDQTTSPQANTSPNPNSATATDNNSSSTSTH
ncbi:fibrinogen-binding protein [Streptococcus pseudoporcinus]|uniref:Lipoprotein n=1 Tax=Streptococcus pseudoporcinus TaxID=361101 RepID=A0A4U9Y498_9STRE|nr:fibrinogen-binding protein [Streptococcus pseudoporcinus]VTS20914.1 lipoprotein [Streptococcus pseudoporcinus]VUC69376.1 lipoprotein [Streptococcus pseudoporcinus]VUC99817.1 lipoprotein [Streptococcus pseudoporcinus]VUD00210.1 lipoprotein [Streptococcus pseudoporcinus]